MSFYEEEDVTIVIPSFPPSPTLQSSRTLSTSPEWFTTPQKAPYRPSPLRVSVSLPIVSVDGSGLDPLSPTGSLSSEPSTPPLSPAYSLASFSMSRTPSASSDFDTEEIRTPPALGSGSSSPTARRTSHTRSSLMPPSYFDFKPRGGNKEKKAFRPRFPSAPVSGEVPPMWKVDEDPISPKSGGLIQLLDPFEMILPTSRRHSEPVYELNEDLFVLAHVPAKSASLLAFKPRMIRVPRWQRPVVITVMSMLLFGSLCMVSWFQQAMLNSGHSAAIRQGEWMVKQASMAHVETESNVDFAAGSIATSPKHHSLKVQAGLHGRDVNREQVPLVANGGGEFSMTKEDELAALANFIVSTAANFLPEIDVHDSKSLEAFLPFNPKSPGAQEELADLVSSQWENHPVMVFGKMRDPKMRDARALLRKYNIKPEPFYVDIDQRADGKTLSGSLERLLGQVDGPYILLKGKNLGGKASSTLAELEKKETLVETIAASGASIAKKLKRNKHQREEERKENERVLGPRPIFD